MAIFKTVYSGIKKELRATCLGRLVYKGIKLFTEEDDNLSELLLRLIEQNQIAVLNPFFQITENEMNRAVVSEIVKDYLDHCGILEIQKTRAKQLAIHNSLALLYQSLALLRIPESSQEYFNAVGAKTRNTIRKAEKQGYEFREFDWNKHMDEIFNINISKDVRSSGPMHGWYVKPVKPQYLNDEEQAHWKYYGIFKNNCLCAYLTLVICGNFAFFKHFIGHASHLKHGIMNYLLFCAVREYVKDPHIEWFNYGIMSLKGSSGEMAFKRHAGFESYATFLNLEHDKKLLKYSKKMWKGDL
jgi:hypothetical protein